jgi:holliday junction DNA helicase RuvB
VLFVGPPGLGKTTLAQIVARELGVNFRSTSGPVIAKAGDLAAQLTNLEPRDVLFIDEIHRLNPAVEEILYPAMEDFSSISSSARDRRRARSRSTWRRSRWSARRRAPGLLTTPLRDRFGIPVRLNFYTPAELEAIVERGARVLGLDADRDGAQRDRAARARHAAHRRPAAQARARFRRPSRGRRRVDAGDRRCGAHALEVDARGLDAMDRAISTIAESVSAAARSASRRSPPRWASRATRSRRSSSPI